MKAIAHLSVGLPLVFAGCLGLSAAPVTAPTALTTNSFISGSQTAAGHSGAPRFSADGRFIAFVSHAPNLVTNDDLAPHLDLFLHDRDLHRTVLVSVNTNGLGGGNADSACPAVSADGQVVAFVSKASNLSPDTTSHYTEVFVRHLTAGYTRRISSNPPAPIYPADQTERGHAGSPQISPDGRWILFERSESHSDHQFVQVYLHDLHSNHTVLVSANLSAGPEFGGAGQSRQASITPDGEFVVFASTVPELFSYDAYPDYRTEIYRRSLSHHSDSRVSSQLYPFVESNADFGCFNPVISAAGQIIAFLSGRPLESLDTWPRFEPPFFLFYNTITNTNAVAFPITQLVASNLTAEFWPSLSADGRSLAYEDGTNVFVWDAETGSNRLVNLNLAGTGPGNTPAHSPTLAPDGTRVAFFSAATDLTPDTLNGDPHLFVRNLLTDTTTLITPPAPETPVANDHAIAWTDTAARVTFASPADDLVPNDRNQATDVFCHDPAIGTLTLVSARHPDHPQHTSAGTAQLAPAGLSSDGRQLAFLSTDSVFLPADTNGWRDAFIQDLLAGTVTPLSVDSTGLFTSFGNATQPVLSTNGQFAAFAWQDPGSTGDISFVYWVDRIAGVRLPVDVTTDGAPSGQAALPQISPDGRCVAFETWLSVTQFVSTVADANNYTNATSREVLSDIVLRDLVDGTNQVININRTGQRTGDSGAKLLGFSPDGRWLLFSSSASDLLTDNTYGPTLFARDLLASQTHPVSQPGYGSGSYLASPVFSGDSACVAFVGYAGGSPCRRERVFIRNLATGELSPLAPLTQAPSLSHAARWLACELLSCIPYTSTNILLLDRNSGTGVPIATGIAAAQSGASPWQVKNPQISPNARFVVYQLEYLAPAQLLPDRPSPGTTTPLLRTASDLYLYDRLLNATLLLTAHPDTGAPLANRSQKPMFSADGHTLLFQSFAPDLLPGDYNDQPDWFLVHLGAQDSDNDGLDDDWELAHFNSLDRDGHADADADGATDAAEFYAGTNPTNNESVLQVLTITQPGSSSATVLWSAVPGRVYQLQYKDNIMNDWTPLAPPITALSTTATLVDPAAGTVPHRFYRALLVPPAW